MCASVVLGKGLNPAADLHGICLRAVRPAVLLLAFLSGCGGCSGPQRPRPLGKAGLTGTASIEGVVTRALPLPGQAGIPQRGAFAECPPAPPRQEPVRGGRVAEALVRIADGLPPGDYPLPSGPVVLDQKGCEYVPRVFGIRAGQDLLVRNGDPTLHNVHALGPPGENAFNLSMPQGRAPAMLFFPHPRAPATITCDVHPWMRAYAGISPHPFFAVTGADGTFVLGGLPAGTYAVEAWHERMGRRAVRVTVKDGEAAHAQIPLD
jgi:hypothetical protein